MCESGILAFAANSMTGEPEEGTDVNKKQDTLKGLLAKLGILLILVGALGVRDPSLAFLLIGLALLAMHTFELRGVQPKKRALAEIILSASLVITAVSQLVLVRGFRAPQFFTVILLLGALLVLVEAVREYAEQ